MNIVIYGAGYVGLTTGTAFAYLGHHVTCVDVDEAKIACLLGGKSPIYEPGLEELMLLAKDNLKFAIDPSDALRVADVVFIAVGTPPLPSGEPNLTYLKEAAYSIGEFIGDRFTVVVNKSTVPIGSGHWVRSLVEQSYARRENANRDNFAVASNPEFLREGSAIGDILYPDRVVIGSEDDRANQALKKLYSPIIDQTFAAPPFLPRPADRTCVPMVSTDLASAELIKYASNAFLCTKISFINEIGRLAEKVGADVGDISRGMGLDSRIGPKFLEAGLGWGGSCFGKDSAALVSTAEDYGIQMPIVSAAREVNYQLREQVVQQLLSELKILKGRRIGLFGLSFKANTDDLRDAPAIDIAKKLIGKGAVVQAHDPIALDRASLQYGSVGIRFCATPLAAAEGADALIIATDWGVFKGLDWKAIGKAMHNPLIIDGRNALNGVTLKNTGLRVIRVGAYMS